MATTRMIMITHIYGDSDLYTQYRQVRRGSLLEDNYVAFVSPGGRAGVAGFVC